MIDTNQLDNVQFNSIIILTPSLKRYKILFDQRSPEQTESNFVKNKNFGKKTK